MSQACGIIMSIILPSLFNQDAANLGSKTGFLFAGLSLIAMGLTYFILPEMKDRSVEELDHMFAIKLPTRQFKNYKIE
jgi:MFS transporter, SP family, general alpha glucoside:H+ symporter